MTKLHEIVAYCDGRLDPSGFDDYCPNGLQVEAGSDVERIVSGVTASLELIEAAVSERADLLLVHHGYFWRGEPQPLVGMKGRRIRALMNSGVSLLAYHLPLDAHPELGNNRQLGLRLGFDQGALVENLLWGERLASPLRLEDLTARVETALGRSPLVVGPERPVQRIAWCTGGAQGMIEQAAALGFDAFISGEISEQSLHQANELDITYIAAGHHATERYGVQTLGNELAAHFGVWHAFIDLDNPA